VTLARTITPELYTELMADLEDLKANRNPWAASWLEILATLKDEANRTAVLAALINGLPALYQQMHAVGLAALKRVAADAYLAPLESDSNLNPLEEVVVGPKPPSVPDHLGALFAATDEELLTELKAGVPVTEAFDKAKTELRRVRDNVRDRVLSADAMLDAILTDAEEEE